MGRDLCRFYRNKVHSMQPIDDIKQFLVIVLQVSQLIYIQTNSILDGLSVVDLCNGSMYNKLIFTF